MLAQTTYDRIRKLSPQAALLAGILTGAVLVAIAFVLEIASVTISKNGVLRQVGYVAAPNWSLTFTFIFPLFVYFALSAIRSADRAFPSLDNMLVEPSGEPDADGASGLARRYRKLLNRSGRVALVLACLVFLGSIAEWYAYSARPLLFGAPVPEGEVDWSVAALTSGAGARAANAAFSFAAFAMQGVYVAALIVFLVYVYVFTELTRNLADATQPPILVPDVESPDHRRGFQRLGRIVEEIIFASACAFVVFWLSRLQNLYLQSSAPSLWTYLRGGVGKTASFSWSDFVKALGDTGEIEFSSAMVLMGALATISVCVGVPLHTLRRAADAARETARQLASKRPRLFAKQCSDEEVTQSLDSMVVWPIAYPRLNELLFWLVFALLSLAFYRIGVAFLAVWVWRLVSRAFQKVATKAGGATKDET
jgi:hypothetical protein